MNIYLKVICGLAMLLVILYFSIRWYLWRVQPTADAQFALFTKPRLVKIKPTVDLTQQPPRRVIERVYIPVQTEQRQTKQAQNLTGVWKCNDGGLYFIRQVGNQVWWYGESGDGGVGWSNVFQGYITGNKIIGKWADVPKGTARNYGEMTLSISSNSLRKISGGQNFTGTMWNH